MNFDGKATDLRIYDEKLSEEEVAKLYEKYKIHEGVDFK